MELATFAGVSISEFWNMTLGELNICLKGHNKKLQIDIIQC